MQTVPMQMYPLLIEMTMHFLTEMTVFTLLNSFLLNKQNYFTKGIMKMVFLFILCLRREKKMESFINLTNAANKIKQRI